MEDLFRSAECQDPDRLSGTADTPAEVEDLPDFGQPAGSPLEAGPAVAGRERRQDRGLLSAQLFAGAESGRTAQLRPEAESDYLGSSSDQARTHANSGRRSAQYSKATTSRSKLLSTKGCMLCRCVTILQGRINNISGNSWSSSILDMLPSHSGAAPESIYIGREKVSVNRLDDICKISPNDRIMLKIDTQGYERQVLEGGCRTISACRVVQSEMSLLQLYEGQMLARELWDLMDALGFELWSLVPDFFHPASFQLLQFDGVFVRRG